MSLLESTGAVIKMNDESIPPNVRVRLLLVDSRARPLCCGEAPATHWILAAHQWLLQQLPPDAGAAASHKPALVHRGESTHAGDSVAVLARAAS